MIEGLRWVRYGRPPNKLKTRALRIEMGQDAGEYVAVSEIYVFGR